MKIPPHFFIIKEKTAEGGNRMQEQRKPQTVCNASPLIVYPEQAPRAYQVAAMECARLWRAVTGEIAETSGRDDGISDLVLIGGEEVNAVTAELALSGVLPSMHRQNGGDGYVLQSTSWGGRHVLLLAGGRGRSTLYAVYRYFELAGGCRYFWDGDRIPSLPNLSLDGFSLEEEPRFAYRGLRYFAHRGLHRFQAEHWSFEDWTREIDWIVKKRLNLFMLRIGMDDLFQKAFPDIVPYPGEEGRLPEAREGYDDRTLFWSLHYRGELRHRVLAYAFERDLIHPEDCGTMTHWYSRTPLAYLHRVKPPLMAQTTEGYRESTGLVWDIRTDENMDAYFALTEAHIRHYGKPEMFHTIGLAERLYSHDREANLRWKRYAYRRILAGLEQRYPGAPLMLASWDLWMYYTPEEVQRLLSDMDPSRVILLDYTSDTVKDNNVTTWGVIGRFPWIFGLFVGYEPDNELRGDFERIEERLRLAAEDPFCQGFVLWPEMSHSDVFLSEYVAASAWAPLSDSLDDRLASYCRDRYGKESERMLALQRRFLPIRQLRSWSVPSGHAYQSLFFQPCWHLRFPSPTADCASEREAMVGLLPEAVLLLNDLAAVSCEDDSMLRRDVYDMARTVIGRYVDYGMHRIVALYSGWLAGEAVILSQAERLLAATEALLATLADLLGGHEDYSLYISLKKLREVTTVNPCFEDTLKENVSCPYCRSFIYETVRYLCLPELHAILSAMKNQLTSGVPTADPIHDVISRQKELNRYFFETPLADLRPKAVPPLSVTLRTAADWIQNLNPDHI